MRGFSEFLKDDSGSETIQFVVFLPLFAVTLVIVTDASFLYLNHSEMWQVARDTARRMASGQLTSEQEAVGYASSHMAMFDNHYQVSAGYDPDSTMAIQISVPIADAMIFGKFLQPVMGQSMVARFEMRAEPEIATGGGGAGGV
jgi:Flp pilus assembly protein TadG